MKSKRKSRLAIGICASIAVIALGSAAFAQEESGFQPDPTEFLNSCASCHGRDGKGAGFQGC